MTAVVLSLVKGNLFSILSPVRDGTHKKFPLHFHYLCQIKNHKLVCVLTHSEFMYDFRMCCN